MNVKKYFKENIFNLLLVVLILIGFSCEIAYEFHLDALSVHEHKSLWEKYRDGIFLFFAAFIYIFDTTGFLERHLGIERATLTVRLVSIALVLIPSVWMAKEAFEGGATCIWIIGPLFFVLLILIFGSLAEEKNPTTSNDNDQACKEKISDTSNDGDQTSKEKIPDHIQ